MSLRGGSILVVGEGLIGNAVAAGLRRQGRAVIQTSRRRVDGFLNLDLAAPAAWPDLPAIDSAVLCAAVARLGDCDADPEGSRRVNVDGIGSLAARLAAAGSHVLLLSSDKVFDGEKPQRARTDAPCPRTEYGRQKAAAEERVLGAGDRTAVLRLSKVLAPGVGLVGGWQESLRRGQSITPYADMYCAPVTVDMVVEMIVHLVGQRRAGIFHCSGASDVSYESLGQVLAAHWAVDSGLIEPCGAALPPSHRPPHSTLEMGLEQALFGIGQPSLAMVVEQLVAG